MSHRVLESIYADMQKRNRPDRREPLPNPTLGGNCYAAYALGDWNLLPSWQRLQKRFSSLVPPSVACFYSPCPEEGTGLLHQTLLQYISFKGFDSVSPEEVEKVNQLVVDILQKYPRAIWLQYRGLTWTPTGLCLQGFPQDPNDYYYVMGIREDIELSLKRAGLPCHIPYKNDIFHATFMRWKEEPSQDLLEKLMEEVPRWEECMFGDLRIRSWTVGKASWRMQDNERKDLYTIPLHRHICHRGNLFEKIKEEENVPAILDARDLTNYDVEIDIWWHEGELWLGHDRPETKTTMEWLSASPRRLIHAKDGKTFEHLLSEIGKRGLNMHIFYHTMEDYILTNKGLVIVCPGIPLLQGSLCMMPEMDRVSREQRDKLFAICSDREDAYKTQWN